MNTSANAFVRGMGLSLGLCLLATAMTLPAFAKALPKESAAEILATEGPVVQLVFESAAAMERSEPRVRNQQYAARLYCVAARLGSLEAQYRLGKMALAGWGMRKSPGHAVALFRIAASQGHEQASLLLAMLDAPAEPLPQCMEHPGSSIDIDAERATGRRALAVEGN